MTAPPPTSMVTPEADPIERTHIWLTGKKKAIEANLSVQAAEIGEFLIETFFHGDAALACSHNPYKEHSLRQLCEHEHAPFSLSALRTFIQVAQNFRVIPYEQAARLPPSHHALLYRVANPEERATLAVKCAQESTSTRRLKELVKGRGRRRPGAGRKPDAPTIKELRALRKRVDKLTNKLDRATVSTTQAIDATQVDDLTDETRKLRDTIATLLERLLDLRSRKSFGVNPTPSCHGDGD